MQRRISPTAIVAIPARPPLPAGSPPRRHYVAWRSVQPVRHAMLTGCRRPTPPRTPNRPATEAALQRAALDLLGRNGVLAGLNLREVADEAGVNRGLVYHYFGSRRDLLRARAAVGRRAAPRRLHAGRSACPRRPATSASSAPRSPTARPSCSPCCSCSTAIERADGARPRRGLRAAGPRRRRGRPARRRRRGRRPRRRRLPGLRLHGPPRPPRRRAAAPTPTGSTSRWPDGRPAGRRAGRNATTDPATTPGAAEHDTRAPVPGSDVVSAAMIAASITGRPSTTRSRATWRYRLDG